MNENAFWTLVWPSLGVAIGLVALVLIIGYTNTTAQFVKYGYTEKYECSQLHKVWVKP